MYGDIAEPEMTVKLQDKYPNSKQGDTEEGLYRQGWNGGTTGDDPQSMGTVEDTTRHQTGCESRGYCVSNWPLLS